MISIAVCDDELLDCVTISAQIRTIMEELGAAFCIEQFQSGGELLKSLGRFDIIFLDILMEGMDGMETARRCRSLAFDKVLVFFSSSRDYVFDAYDVEAFHYLVKPVDQEKLRQVLKRATEKERLLSQDYIVVSRERQKRKIFLDSVRYFEIKGRQIDEKKEKGVFMLFYLF